MADEMRGKTVVVTGANSGIGLATASALAQLGAQVCMVCRDQERGRAALDRIKRVGGATSPDLLLADFASLESVRALAAQIRERHSRLDVLVNNAGGIFGTRKLTQDGYEWTFQVNHLAPFLLSNLLLPLLEASAPARVVTVSSTAHRRGHLNFDDLMGERQYSAPVAYGQSKLANILFAFQLARLLQETGVTSNCLHPGVVHTRFANSGNLTWRLFFRYFGFLLLSPEKGARTSVYLASSPAVAGVTGAYFIKCKPAQPAKEARDTAIATRLWDVSAQLVHLPPRVAP
jgi:NAD(P)-dependent dehydrogenase (short-subunit alcohol dehydrogenase family)